MDTSLVGKKIRTERKRLKLTLQELAEKSGSSRSYIWELENKTVVRPSAEKINKIAVALGVTIEFLIEDEKNNFLKEDSDKALFRKIALLDSNKRVLLEKFLSVIDD